MIDVTEPDVHPSRRIARSSTRSSASEPAAPIRALATEAVPARDRSLPAALCTVAGEIGFGAADRDESADREAFEAVLEPVVTGVTLLEGYLRLRLTLVGTAEDVTLEGAPTVDRDEGILASDLLHARAYATVVETPVPDRQRLELYRVLLEGSTALSRQFLIRADADETAADRFGATATLAETAGAIGAAAVDASAETRTALRRYSHAMMTALASQSSATPDDVHPQASAARVLFDPTYQHAVASEAALAYATPAVERSLERARTALETLADGVTDDVSSPLGRLERATRIPFHQE